VAIAISEAGGKKLRPPMQIKRRRRPAALPINWWRRHFRSLARKQRAAQSGALNLLNIEAAAAARATCLVWMPSARI